MYNLLTGTLPFIGDTLEETLVQVSRCCYSFNLPIFKKVSKNAIDLISKMMGYYP